jgi:hypothetical protein
MVALSWHGLVQRLVKASFTHPFFNLAANKLRAWMERL